MNEEKGTFKTSTKVDSSYLGYNCDTKEHSNQKPKNISEVLNLFDELFVRALPDGTQYIQTTSIPHIHSVLKDSFTSLIKGIELEERETDDDGYGCISCGLDKYECKCHIYNQAVKKVKAIINKIIK